MANKLETYFRVKLAPYNLLIIYFLSLSESMSIFYLCKLLNFDYQDSAEATFSGVINRHLDFNLVFHMQISTELDNKVLLRVEI